MRTPDPKALSRLLIALALLPAFAGGASAQTATEQKPPPLPSGGPARAHAHPRHHAAPAATAGAKGPQSSAIAAAKPGQPVIPTAPPPPPVLPPPIIVPTRPPPPPPPTPVATDAPDTASKIADGLRVTFGATRADLNPESDAAITALAHAAPSPDATFNVTAYAEGGDDPSTPRRLSLSRALAVRSALMAAGIASVRIYVKALGASGPDFGEGPPDRVDIAIAAGPGPAPASSQAAPAQHAAAPPGAPAPPELAPPWGQRPATTPSGEPPTDPAATEKADP